MQFKLCPTCWVSKNIDKFYEQKSICKDCIKKRLRTPRGQYVWEQEQKPLEEQMKICSDCIEEKYLISDFRSDTSSGYLKYKTYCKVCESKKKSIWFQNRGPMTDKQRESYNKSQRNYTKRRRAKDPEFVETLNSYKRSRRALKEIQEYTLTEHFFLDLLEIYGEVCMYPGCDKTDELEYDHIIPVNWGRICDWSMLNAQILCASHNRSKKDKYSMDFRSMEIPIGDEEPAGNLDIRDFLLL